MLEKSCKKFMLFREANELQQWINEKESALTSEEVGSDLEQVEVLQKKFDDFQKVMQGVRFFTIIQVLTQSTITFLLLSRISRLTSLVSETSIKWHLSWSLKGLWLRKLLWFRLR